MIDWLTYSEEEQVQFVKDVEASPRPGEYRTDLESIKLAMSDPICVECEVEAKGDALDLQIEGWGVNHHGALMCKRCIQGLPSEDLTPRC